MVPERWERVREAARGVRGDYRLSASDVREGGQARVHRAVHKASGVEVAFKKLRDARDPEALARMRREIDVGRSIQHPNLMPVIDAGSDGAWFVMPWAEATLAECRSEVSDTEAIRAVVADICAGLAPIHESGQVHRDVKPENVLRLGSPPRWVVSDCGLVRNPVGETTTPGRTRLGVAYGTEGFAAPELSVDAHAATPGADIYGIGQIIGWALTGAQPLQNVPLLPDGPWRSIVRAATRFAAADRLQSVEDLGAQVARTFAVVPLLPIQEASDILDSLEAGSTNNEGLDRLFDLAALHADDYALYIDQLPRLGPDQIRAAVGLDPNRAREVARAMEAHLGGDWGRRNYRWADQVIFFLFRVAEEAVARGDLGLLEEAVGALLAWDGNWDQYPPQGPMARWMTSLKGAEASVVAQALRAAPDAAEHFSEVADDPSTALAIRQAINARLGDA